MGNGPLHNSRPVSALGALVVTAGLLGGCVTSPYGQRASLGEAQAAYQRQDFGTAARMLKPLAYEGNAEAQYALGYMYYYGHGVKRNRGFAMSWFGEAVRLGHEKAREALAAVQSEARFTHLPPGAQPETEQHVGEPVKAANAPAQRGRVAELCGDISPERKLPERAPGGGGREPGKTVPAFRHTAAADIPAAARASGSATGTLETTSGGDSRIGAVAPGADTGFTPPVQPSADRSRQAAGEAHGRGGAPLAGAESGPPAQAAAPGRSPEAKRSAKSNTPAPSSGHPRFTLQLIGSRSRADLERLVERFGLEDVHYIKSELRGGPWYRLLYSRFNSLDEARRALEALAPELGRHQPFVRNFPALRMASLDDSG